MEEAAALCEEVRRLREQLAMREAVLAGTLRISIELVREVERVRETTERITRPRAERLGG